MPEQQNNEPVTIKKYPNRRLYNTQTSCYVKFEDLFDMIRRGEDFVVIDVKTNEDLTRSVLTQIIFEQEAKGYNLLPISFLKQLIMLYKSGNMSEVLPDYLDLAMDNFVKHRDNLTDMTPESWQQFSPVKIFEDMTKSNMDIFNKTMSMFDVNKKKDD